MEAGLEFVALDNPHANTFTLHVLAAVAEQEARATSERTKVALAAAKRRGVLLGSARPGHWQGLEAKRLAGSRVGVRRAAEARTQAAKQHNSLPVAEALRLRREGRSWLEVAAELNARGLVTRRGGHWSKSSIFTAVRAAAGCMLVAEATADVLAGLGNSLNTTLTSMATAVEAALA
jgi:DNA invertase Pin-like site-specific DNA recombinase